MNTIRVNITINNLPEEITREYVVVRRDDDGSLWYWGQYDDYAEASYAAVAIGNGFVVEVE